MTPKEKAKDLYDSYWYCLFQSNIEKRNYWSKQCSLIAVDEMLDFRNGLYINEGSLAHKYLLDIKHEIENYENTN
jgi:hypothetical protein